MIPENEEIEIEEDEDESPDLDVIMDAIEAKTSDDTEPEEAMVAVPMDDIDERRKVTWELRQRGKTYREIAAVTQVSISTVKTDLDHGRRVQREQIEFHDREDYLAGINAQYDDIRREAWNVFNGADKDTKLKALNLIRQTTDAQRKALQDTGVVRKENQVQETVQVNLVSRFSDDEMGVAAAALISTGLNQHLGAPTPDIDDAEIVEDEDEDEEDI
jgi:hypothetical protein